MKKTFKIKNLDCANCAAKIERNIAKLPHVNACSLSFMSERLTLDYEDNYLDEILEASRKIAKKIDPSSSIEG